MKNYPLTSALLAVTAALGAWLPTPASAALVDDAFTYQGQLQDTNGPVNGIYDFRFRLYTHPTTAGSAVFSLLTVTNVTVTDGRFTASLNFSNTFDGTAYWMRVDVRTNSPNGSLAYVSLSPRQQLTAVPYARQATNATYADAAGTAATAGTATNANSASRVAANAIAATNILDASITSSKLATNIAVWTKTLANVYYNGGLNVGIGTTDPSARLSLGGGNANTKLAIWDGGDPSNTMGFGVGAGADQFRMHLPAADRRFSFLDAPAGTEVMTIRGSGNVGIGTTAPDAKLEVVAAGTNDAALRITSSSAVVNFVTPASKLELMDDTNGGWTIEKDIAGHLNIHEGTNPFALHRLSIRKGTGHVGIGDYADNSSYASRVLAIQGNASAAQFEGTAALVLKDPTGRGNWSIGNYTDGKLHITRDGGSAEQEVVVPILTVVGGSDIAEPFNVSGEEAPQPGMVVSIDPERTGELRVCTRAYDSTVAGIVSGAGGVKTGMTLKQDGTAATGKLPVALTGRVYCYVDADAGGPVVPGDLLTTSDTPGHAMKVTDRARAGGATLGKAMSSLQAGKGLVLVLVSLQ